MHRRVLWNPHPDYSPDSKIGPEAKFKCHKCCKPTSLIDGYFIHPISELNNGTYHRINLVYCKSCASDLMITCDRCCNDYHAVLGFYEDIENEVNGYGLHPNKPSILCHSCARDLDRIRHTENRKIYSKHLTFKEKLFKVLAWSLFGLATVVGTYLFQIFLEGFNTKPFSVQYHFIGIITYLNPLFWMYLCLFLFPKWLLPNRHE